MIFSRLSRHLDIGLLVVRIGIGFGFLYYHGWAKLTGGMERWSSLGGVMDRFGIGFWEPFWGFMISFAESIGALMILVGILTAPMSLILAFGMLVAWTGHVASGQGNPGHSFKNMIVLIGLAVAGPGRYSVDAWILQRSGKIASDDLPLEEPSSPDDTPSRPGDTQL